jgi:hypothetical protein
MNGIQTVIAAVKASHDWFNGTVADVTHPQAIALPAGVTHPIGELITHILNSEDGTIHSMAQGKPTIWERDGWGKKLGVANMMFHDNRGARAFKVDPASLVDYQKAVQAATVKYLGGLKDADLDRLVDAGPLGKVPLGGLLLNGMVGNTFAHTGEISALKGLHGAKGYPF